MGNVVYARGFLGPEIIPVQSAVGDAVNLEVDVMSKYAERLLGFATAKADS